jgi:hypothetical protein
VNVKFLSAGTDIQVVEMIGTITDAEGAAVRFKLDAKINEGRHKILFSLPQFHIEDETSKRALHLLISYCLNRRVLLVVSDLPPDKWPFIRLANGASPAAYLSRAEALTYLAGAPAPTGVQAYEEPAPPSTSTKEEKKSDQDIKDIAMKELLKKYELFQQSDEDDPFRLGFLKDQYRSQPSFEIVKVEKQAQARFEELDVQNRELEAQCEQLAKQVQTRRAARRLPTSETELNLKAKTFDGEIENAKTKITELVTQIKSIQGEIANIDAEEQNNRKQLEADFQALDTQVKSEAAATDQLIRDLTARDEQEKMAFEAKKKSLLEPK